MNYNDYDDDYEEDNIDMSIYMKNVNKNKKEDEMIELEEMDKKLQENIRSLWNNIMLPYIENINEKQILFQLTKMDYYKFHSFMINNNEICQYIYSRLDYLQNKK